MINTRVYAWYLDVIDERAITTQRQDERGPSLGANHRRA